VSAESPLRTTTRASSGRRSSARALSADDRSGFTTEGRHRSASQQACLYAGHIPTVTAKRMFDHSSAPKSRPAEGALTDSFAITSTKFGSLRSPGDGNVGVLWERGHARAGGSALTCRGGAVPRSPRLRRADDPSPDRAPSAAMPQTSSIARRPKRRALRSGFLCPEGTNARSCRN
jgi:hypothetical protein